MGVVIPQVVTSDRATGAQVIDGSLKFDSGQNTKLSRTPGSAGNRKTWTWSGWVKRTPGAHDFLFNAKTSSTLKSSLAFWSSNDYIRFKGDYNDGTNRSFSVITSALFRDTGWYHVVTSLDTTQSTDTDRIKIYVNGVLQELTSTTYPTQNSDIEFNNTSEHLVGSQIDSAANGLDGALTNVTFVDGQALDASYFGFTDGLTNTWKPKKYEGTFGTNGFYLPLDGNSPIGQDQSGNGNNWTPVNFGGSLELDNPNISGARPILNTTQGGAQAGVGVFGSKQNVGYAVTVYDDGGGNKYYIDGVKQATLTGLIRGATYTFDTSDSTVSSHPFRFSESDGGSEYTNGVAAITGTATTITIPYNSSNELYYYCTSHSGMGSSITGITTNEKLADQYASNCVLAVPFVGSTKDASAGLACTSTRKADTNTGSTAANALSNFYSGSRDFDGSNDTCSFASVPACGAGDWTVEFWLYSEASAIDSVYRRIVSTGTNATSAIQIGHIGSDAASGGYITYTHSDNSVYAVNTSNVMNRWAHIAVVRESGSVNVYTDGIKGTTADSDANDKTGTTWYVSGYGGSSSSGRFNGKIQDLRVYPGTAKYTSNFVPAATFPDILPDTPSGVSGGSKLTKILDTNTEGAVVFDGDSDYLSSTGPGTLAASSNWCMECTFYCTGTSSGTYRIMGANESSESSEYLQMRIRLGQYQFYTENANTLTGTAAFNKWTHMALTKSGTTVRAFVDGKQLWSTTDNNADDITTLITGWGYGSEYFPGFISNARFVNGSSVYTSEFNPPVVPLTNITNTTHLFCQSNTSATAAAVGTITANGTAAASRFTPFNTDINTVRGQETGYATLNPLRGELTLSDGNLHAVGVSNWGSQTADFLMSSGKWYYEYHDVVSNEHVIGIGPPDVSITGNLGSGTPPGFGYGSETGVKYSDGGNSSYGDSWTSGDVIGVAFDADAGELSFYKNGIDQGVAFTGLTTEYVPVISINDTSRSASVNFGQKPFKFPPPDGFQPLNTANVRPETVISRPDQYVGIATWTGDGTNNRVIQAPIDADFAWIKFRDQAYSHSLYDTVRGNNTRLVSNDTATEGTVSFSFLDNKNIQISGASDTSQNDNNEPLVGWFWKAGGNKNTFNVDNVGYSTYTTAPGLDEGALKISGASVGTKQGFSIIKYVGNATQPTTVPHGLNSALDFMIVKNLTTANNWAVFHKGLIDGGTVRYLRLNTTDGRVTGSGHFGNTAPTDTVFTLGSDDQVNKLNNDFIAYCWHSVPGFSKFGSFITNNSSTEYVHLGFKPAIVWIKRTGGGSTTNLTTYGSWYVNNSETSPINPASYEEVLWLNRNYAEGKRGNGGGAGTYLNVDFLSDGFRLRGTANAEIGQPNDINIYCAWAEAPSVDLYGGGANAR